MQSKIVLISDDSDFFEYIIPKLNLRNSDELFSFKFAELPEKLPQLTSSLLIVNSENCQQQTLELLDIIKNIPVIVFSYNVDNEFKIEAYKRGMYAYFTLSTTDEEIDAKLVPALRLISSIEKTSLYRELLVNNNVLTKNNEVFLDFTNILEREIKSIKKNATVATLVAISPDDNLKYTIQPNKLETIILNNIRNNDILMNYSYNKYFLLLKNVSKEKAVKIWDKLKKHLPEGVCAGFALVSNKSRQQIVSEVLNNLHDAMSSGNLPVLTDSNSQNTNFKFFRQEFIKKLSQVVSPVFYHIQETYNNKVFGMHLEAGTGDGYSALYIKSHWCVASFRITSPGFSTVNIDITYKPVAEYADYITNFNIEPKRITVEPDDFEEGFLHDLVEEFIREFKDYNDKIINTEG